MRLGPGALGCGFAYVISQALLCSCQASISIPSVTQHEVISGNSPVALSVPSTTGKVNLTVAVCSSDIPFPNLYIYNGTGPADPTEGDVGIQLVFDGGVAVWEGEGPATLYAYPPPDTTGSRFFEVGINNGGTICSVCAFSMPQLDALTWYSCYLWKKFAFPLVRRYHFHPSSVPLCSVCGSS